jgi:hypothetical protein
VSVADRLEEYLDYYRVRAAKYVGSPIYQQTAANERALLEAFERAPTIEEAAPDVVACSQRAAAALVIDQERARAAFYDEIDEPFRARASREVLAAVEGLSDPVEVVNVAASVRAAAQNAEVVDELVRSFESDLDALELLEVYTSPDIPQRWQADYAQAAADTVAGLARVWREERLPAARQWDPAWTLRYETLWETRHRRRIPFSDEMLGRRIAEHRTTGWV